MSTEAGELHHQLAEPLRVRDVGLAAGHVLDVARVAERQLEVVFEQLPDRLPVDAGGLHRDVRDLMRGQPIAQCDQAPHRGLKLGQLRRAPPGGVGHAHTRGDLRLVHIERADALKDRFHRSPPVG